MTARARLLASLGVVAVLVAGHVALKTRKIFRNPTWDPQNPVGQFWSESAFQYRFAEFFAQHPLRDWDQLAHDRSVQYPDAVDDWAEFTVAMEVPVGVLYRWWRPAVPFHVFVVWYDCLVSSLALFGVFFLARALWRSDGAGLLASLLYATLYPSYGRTVKNLFLREDFAVPLLVFALAATVWMLQRDGDPPSPDGRGREALARQRESRRQKTWRLRQILAALLWLAALASWHLTQFVLAVAVGATVLVYLGQGETPRRPWFVLLLTVGAVAIPVLRAKQFYLSPTMDVLYALSLAVWIDGGRRKATLVFAGWLVVFVALGMLLQTTYNEYAHVYQLFFSKLRFLGVKPEDPARLPWEARCLWEGAFNTAGWREFWHSLQWCGPLALVAILRSTQRVTTPVRIFGLFTLFLFPLAWMVVRFFTFLGLAAAVMVAGLWGRRWWWKPVVAAVAIWQLASLNLRPLDRTPVVPSDYQPVVHWIADHTPTNAVLLASIAESPVLLAHTGRPIILHSKFENRRIRERYRQLLEAIYGSEDRFYRFCRQYGADYFVYDTGFLLRATDSRRYKADRLEPLNPRCAAMLFQFAPQHLRHFEPEFVDGRFAVFRVLK